MSNAKPLNSRAKEIIGNVLSYLKKEISEPSCTPLTAYIQKTAEATQVSERTIHRIQKEQKDSVTLLSPQRSTLERELTVVDDFDRCVIRNKIHELYTVRHQLPTFQNLHDVLRAEIDFHGGKSVLRKIVRQLGFRWKKSKSDREVLVEKQSIVDQRLKYYARKKKLEQEGYNFVFIDETWIDTAYTAKYC